MGDGGGAAAAGRGGGGLGKWELMLLGECGVCGWMLRGVGGEEGRGWGSTATYCLPARDWTGWLGTSLGEEEAEEEHNVLQ